MSLRTAAAAAALVLCVAAAVAVLRHSPDAADGGAPVGEAARDRGPRPPVGAAAGACDLIASPLGRHERGTIAGAQRLVQRLRPGQTGCLRAGRYDEDVTIGASDVALRSEHGRRATIAGRFYVRGEVRDVTVSHLRLDGRNPRLLPSPTINGDRVTFSHVDVTNDHTAICFNVGGSARYGRPQGTVIAFSRIHDCGVLPPRNSDHGIYVAAADDTRILGNLIYDNADRGIQLYPDAQRTLVAGNVIDGNGSGIIFSGAGPVTSRDNVVRNNVIANSRVRANVESYYPEGTPAGTGNVVTRNCLYGGRGRMRIEPGGLGFSAGGNVYADPRYADRARGDFRVAPSSPCAPLLRAGLAQARRLAR